MGTIPERERMALGSRRAPSRSARALQTGPRRSSPTARFAEEACAILTSPKFQACHDAVGPLPYLQNCHYDVCSCSDGRDCLCDAVATYAAACARRGVHIGWREPGFCGGCPPRPHPLRVAPGFRWGPCWSCSEHRLCVVINALGHGPRA